ncbi:MAG: site-specific integrase [Nocardioides sp.]
MKGQSRRPRGEGGLSWDDKRQRWIAARTVGYDARGKRIVRRASGTSPSAAMRELRRRVKDYEDGLVPGSERYTVGQAVEDWLEFGLPEVDGATLGKYRDLCETHLAPNLGGRRLRDLRAPEVDRWLLSLTGLLSSRSLQEVRSCLNRSVRQAMARGFVERNVVDLCRTPRGKDGRPSKSLSPQQARDVLIRTAKDPLHCYIVVSLLTGARTEELRALRWEHVHLEPDSTVSPAVPPHVEVWRSARVGGETKTRKSRRTLALPALAVESLKAHRRKQAEQRLRASSWGDEGVVFASEAGTEMDAANVRRGFRRALRLVPGIDPEEWTPREMRHTFVSLLSDSGLHVDQIALLVGHVGGSQVTERIYRKQLRPVIQTGATAMDMLFGDDLLSGDDG